MRDERFVIVCNSLERRQRSTASQDKPSKEKCTFSCGFAALKATAEGDSESGACWSEPVHSAMKAGDFDQLVGKAAEEFLAALGEKAEAILRKTVENGERKEDEYYLWMRKCAGAGLIVISVKCVENHLAGQTGRRVKWRDVSTGRVSIYRYSMAVIPIGFGTRVARCIRKNRKLCLILVWLFFVGLICLTVVLGSMGSSSAGEGENHPAAAGPSVAPSTRIGRR